MYKLNRLRCIHRHSIETHPRCFELGKIKGSKYESWYDYNKLKLCYLDIESDGLKADFSTMLTWCIKDRKGEIHYDTVTKDDLFLGKSDRRIIQSCIDEISKYDVVCTYYGKVFDVPFLRTKALHYDIPFPGFISDIRELKNGKECYRSESEILHFDIYYLVKSKLNLSRKSLDNVCDYLHIDGKTQIDKEVWRRGKYGDPEALKKILNHNKHDCIILEKLHNKLENQSKWTRSPL